MYIAKLILITLTLTLSGCSHRPKPWLPIPLVSTRIQIERSFIEAGEWG
jgi:hypothetical protein